MRQTIADTLGIGGIFRTLRTAPVVQAFAKEMEQVCPNAMFWMGMLDDVVDLQWKIAGINHQAWLLEITDGGKDLYPEIRKRAAKMNREARKKGGEKHGDMVRLEMMRHFGYYITESSEHSAEYMPYWIKNQFPEMIEEFNIPLDEYP